jgi:hypothetical protein
MPGDTDMTSGADCLPTWGNSQRTCGKTPDAGGAMTLTHFVGT